MSSDSIQLTAREADYKPNLNYYNSDKQRCYTLDIKFGDSLLSVDFAMNKKDQDQEVENFISAYENKTKEYMGITWHDYCADSVFKIESGKINLYLVDGGKKPTLQLSDLLATDLIEQIKSIKH